MRVIILVITMSLFNSCILNKSKSKLFEVRFFGQVSIIYRNVNYPMPCSLFLYKDSILLYEFETDKNGKFDIPIMYDTIINPVVLKLDNVENYTFIDTVNFEIESYSFDCKEYISNYIDTIYLHPHVRQVNIIPDCIITEEMNPNTEPGFQGID